MPKNRRIIAALTLFSSVITVLTLLFRFLGFYVKDYSDKTYIEGYEPIIFVIILFMGFTDGLVKKQRKVFSVIEEEKP